MHIFHYFLLYTRIFADSSSVLASYSPLRLIFVVTIICALALLILQKPCSLCHVCSLGFTGTIVKSNDYVLSYVIYLCGLHYAPLRHLSDRTSTSASRIALLVPQFALPSVFSHT